MGPENFEMNGNRISEDWTQLIRFLMAKFSVQEILVFNNMRTTSFIMIIATLFITKKAKVRISWLPNQIKILRHKL